MKLYDCLMTSWSDRIHEKTNDIILSLQWIINMDETINELSILLRNEDLHTEFHKHQVSHSSSMLRHISILTVV